MYTLAHSYTKLWYPLVSLSPVTPGSRLTSDVPVRVTARPAKMYR